MDPNGSSGLNIRSSFVPFVFCADSVFGVEVGISNTRNDAMELRFNTAIHLSFTHFWGVPNPRSTPRWNAHGERDQGTGLPASADLRGRWCRPPPGAERDERPVIQSGRPNEMRTVMQ